MKMPEVVVRGLAINDNHRKKGASVIDGQQVEWDEADILTLIPMFDEKGLAKKYVIEPSKVKSVGAVLEDVNWGSVVDVTLQGKNVVAVEVVLDYLNDLPIA